MLRESADRVSEPHRTAFLETIESALTPPASWRDPSTGLPYGFGDEDDEWSEWEAQMRR